MTNAHRFVAPILTLSIVGALWLICFPKYVRWEIPAIACALIVSSLALIRMRKTVGYALGEVGLFLLFLTIVLVIIPDRESYNFVAVPISAIYFELAVASVLFLLFEYVLRTARTQLTESAYAG